MSQDERSSGDRPLDLRVEFEAAPINVPVDAPRFAWRVDPVTRGAGQTAYRILVARSRDAVEAGVGDAWDSGTVDSSRSAGVAYRGAPLAPDETYHWTVRVWNEHGEPGPFAEPSRFTTALAADHEWEGSWIGHQPDGGDSNGWRSRWHPAGADAREWVQVDLGERTDVAAVELGPADPIDGTELPDGWSYTPLHAWGRAMGSDDESLSADDGTGFGFPESFRIEVADDPGFADATTVAERTRDATPDEPVAVETDAAGRYVRVTATDLYEFDPANLPLIATFEGKVGLRPEELRPWELFALASLAVRDADGVDRAREQPVTASSSAETGAWGTEKLVDGRTASAAAATSPLLRTTVHCSKPVKRARLHVAALGYGEAYLNGERVGDAVLDPAWTTYDERIDYATHEVGEHLSEGENALGLWLGRGRFSSTQYAWTGFGSPRALVRLSIEYADGTTTRLVSDSNWRAAPSPIVENDIYDGETYDARREREGWATPGFDDGGWATAAEMPDPGGDLSPERIDPIRVTDEVPPDSLTDHGDAVVVDFGRNLAGWVELAVEGAEAGDEITIEHAEILDGDGRLQTADLGHADATDTYVARGDGRERYEPRFTYHGFRYAAVSGYPGELDAGDIRAKVVHTDMDRIGSFECSNGDLNRVHEAAVRSLQSNAHSLPTDCPQRPERFGWTGDAHLAGGALLYNFDAARFHEKWQADHDDAQSHHGYVADTIPYGIGSSPGDPTWTVTRVVLPWALYQQYGDRRVLAEHYEGMRRYVEFWADLTEDGVLPRRLGNYGDWLAFERQDDIDERRGMPFDLFNTAFHYLAADRLAGIADLLGHAADAERFRDHAETVAAAFDERYFDAEAGRYDPGSQAAQAVPLFVGLVPDERVDAVVESLVAKVREEDDGQLQTGFLGTRALLSVLGEHAPEVAYEVVSQPERPGWVYMVQQGATTLWERWDSDDRIGSEMNSFNHQPLAMISEWFYRTLAGIEPDESVPGYERAVIDPAFVDDLDRIDASVDTRRGELAVAWERTGAGLAVDVTVPWNATAEVHLPAGEVSEGDVTLAPGDDTPAGVESVGEADGRTVVTVGAGEYAFSLARD